MTQMKDKVPSHTHNKLCEFSELQQLIQCFDTRLTMNRPALSDTSPTLLPSYRFSEFRFFLWFPRWFCAGKRLKELVSGLEVTLSHLTEELQREGQRIPNSTHPDVPRGGEEIATLIKEVRRAHSSHTGAFMRA